MERYVARPPWWMWFVIPLSSMFCALPLTGIVVALLKSPDSEVDRRSVQLTFVIVAALVGIAMWLFMRRGLYWELADGVLYRGPYRESAFPLCDVVALRIGMATLENEPVIPVAVAVFMSIWVNNMRERAVVLTFRDKTLLALDVTNLRGGRALMERLVSACGGIHGGPYSESERRAMSKGRMNSPVRIA